MISSKDLKEVVDRLTGDQKLTDEDMQQLIDNVRYCKFGVRTEIQIR